MSNLSLAVKAIDKIEKTNTPREVLVTVRVRGDSGTMRQLEAVGETDLEKYFIPKALCLNPGDLVDVKFIYP